LEKCFTNRGDQRVLCNTAMHILFYVTHPCTYCSM